MAEQAVDGTDIEGSRAEDRVAQTSGGSIARAPIQLSLPLVPLKGLIQLPDGDVRRDGGSRPSILIRAADHCDYYCKGPSLIPGHPFVGANELLAARLARLAGLATRPTELIAWNGELFAGSQLLPNDRKLSGGLTKEVWGRLENAPEVAYEVVAFDVWILNEDRHDGNWLGAVLSGGGTFLVMDHDLALFGQGRSITEVRARVAMLPDQSLVRSSVLREAIQDPTEIERAVAMIQGVDDAALASEIGHLPSAWADDEAKRAILDVLRIRRDSLQTLLDSAPAGLFPNLKRA